MLLKRAVCIITCFTLTLAYANETKPYKGELQLSWLDLKPISNNYTYAYKVAGTQPYYQNWYAQAFDPAYHSAFELGFQYAMSPSSFYSSIDWLHFNSNDKATSQGNQTTEVSYIEFVGPPFEMSPPVFGIRRADASLNYDFDNFALNLHRAYEPNSHWGVRVAGGLNIVRLKQTISTTFSDYVGAEPTPYSYALPADPSFSFNIQSISNFIGIGPDVGLNGRWSFFRGISLIGAAFGSLNVGTTSVQENFTATSERLTREGIGVSKQQVLTPNKTQLVPAFDGKLGLLYELQNARFDYLGLEAGYRLMTYFNAISTTTPQTLVQPGTTTTTPEFSTGTMAIVSMTQQDRPFSLTGPYITLRIFVL